MSLTISPQIRIVALLGIVLAVVAGGAFTFLGRGSVSTAPVKRIVPLSQRHTAAKTTPAHAAKATPSHAAKATPSHAVKRRPTHAKTQALPHAKPVTATPKPEPAAKPKPAPKPKPLANPYNLPLPLVRALNEHATVVVALYSAESRVDMIAYAEARAGAAAVGGTVGFVGLNVLQAAQVRSLTEQLGVLPDPGLLVYRRPGILAARINGFADRETVAQVASGS
jgi:hypothetical protein